METQGNNQLSTNPMSESLVDTITQKCKVCGKDFEAHLHKAMGITFPPSKVCPACGEAERAKREEDERISAEISAKKQRAGWLKSSGIPLRYYDSCFSNFVVSGANKRVVEICKEYAGNFCMGFQKSYKSLGLISPGAWGIGKTHLICSIARDIIERWDGRGEKGPVCYTSEPSLFLRIRATFNRGNDGVYQESENDVYKQLANIPLLMIDDVGKEEISDPRFVQRVWYSIVNVRYESMKPMIITANLTPDEIASHLGGSRNNEATFDRLYEMLGGAFYELTGKSYRRSLLK